MKLRYTERTKDDLELAFMWYERQRRWLGFEFLDRVENAVKSIPEHPEMYRIHYSLFRGCVIRRFPFSMFSVEENEIIVHSIFDNREDQKKRPNAIISMKLSFIEVKRVNKDIHRQDGIHRPRNPEC